MDGSSGVSHFKSLALGAILGMSAWLVAPAAQASFDPCASYLHLNDDQRGYIFCRDKHGWPQAQPCPTKKDNIGSLQNLSQWAHSQPRPPASVRPPVAPSGPRTRNGPSQSACGANPPKNVKRIVVGFDGLTAYNSSSAAQLRRRGAPPLSRRPMQSRVSGGVIDGMIAQGAAQVPGVHWEYFGHYGVNSSSVACIKELATKGYRNKDGKMVYPTVVVMGHSWGGPAANDMVQSLKAQGVAVDLVVTADPRHKMFPMFYRYRKTNEGKWINFYQQNWGLPGYPVTGAENIKLRSSHTGIAVSQEIRQRIMEEVARLPLCKASPGRTSISQIPVSCPN